MKMRGLEKWALSSPAWAVLTNRLVVPRLVAGAGLPERAVVLQVGCGAGGETEGLARRFAYWRITATDYDADMVTRAGKRLAHLGERVTVERADATALGYPDGAFDLLIGIHVWHHVGDWRAATTEAHRVLRAGGTLLLADFVVPRHLARAAPRLAPSGSYTLAEIRAALTAAGFMAAWSHGPGWYRALACRQA